MNDSEWLAEPEAVTREDRIRALERMVMVARPEFRPGRVPPMARALATIAATLLEHERRLSPDAAGCPPGCGHSYAEHRAASAPARTWTLEEIRAAWFQAQETARPEGRPPRRADDLENSWEHVRGALTGEPV